MMTIARIRASEVRNRIGDILARVRYGGEHVVVERRGQPVAAIIGIEEYEHLIQLRRRWEASQRRSHFQAIRASAAENDLTEEETFQLLDEAG
jgi:prevent-host-death family protein